jgi:hypothetical protein
VVPEATSVATSPQFGVPNQTDVFSIADSGAIQVRWVVGAGKWHGPLTISAPGLAPAGAHLVASGQFGVPNQTDVFVVDGNGAIQRLWVQGAGKWNGPLAISPNGSAPPGAGLAVSPQLGVPNQTDVFSVATNGAEQVSWVQGAGTWNGPLAISSQNLAPAGAHLAVSPQVGVPNQTDVFVVDTNGALRVTWVQGAAKWNGPLAISSNGSASVGGHVAASQQVGLANQTDLFSVLDNGAVHVSWVDGAGKWNGPAVI